MTWEAMRLKLIMGDQLNHEHSWFARPSADELFVMMEVRQETDYVLHHAQKIIAIFAAMRDFARRLREAGHRVHYLAIDDAENRQSVPANLDYLLAHHAATEFRWQAPDEWRLDRQLADYAAALPIATAMDDTEHFYTTRAAILTRRRCICPRSAREPSRSPARPIGPMPIRNRRTSCAKRYWPGRRPATGAWN